MENSDKELILKVSKSNAQLRRLYQEHVLLEDMLSSFTKKGFLTAEEELEEKILKKRKLLGVDRMMSLLSDHREEGYQAEPQAMQQAG